MAYFNKHLSIEDVRFNSIISSASCSYMVHSLKGEGVYGKVAKCTKQKTGKEVAIKFLSPEAAEPEVRILKKLQQLNPDENNLIRFHEAFRHKQYTCLVFELLDNNLAHLMLMKDRFSLSEIRVILKELFVCLRALKRIGIIHSDIKLDNIMVRDQPGQKLKLKLIDFGCALCAFNAKPDTRCQPAGQKAPEVLLGVTPTVAIDMWSVGLLAAQLFLEEPLFVVKQDYNALRCIIETLGEPPEELLDNGVHTQNFFTKVRQEWTFKTPAEYRARTGNFLSFHPGPSFKDLKDLKGRYKVKDKSESEDLDKFLDLLKQMLAVDPRKRIIPGNALEHDFITREDLESDFSGPSTSSNMNGCTSYKNVDCKNGCSVSNGNCTTRHKNGIIMAKEWCGQSGVETEGKLSKKIRHFFSSVIRMVLKPLKLIKNCCSMFRALFYSDSNLKSTVDAGPVHGGSVHDPTRDGSSKNTDDSVGVSGTDSSSINDASVNTKGKEEDKIQDWIRKWFSCVFWVVFKPLQKIKNYFSTVFWSNSPYMSKCGRFRDVQKENV